MELLLINYWLTDCMTNHWLIIFLITEFDITDFVTDSVES